MKINSGRNSFTGQLGFILAAAGSAVGLGNIWRFPYLAAKDGGGLFLFIYLILAVTFGYTMLFSEITLGRKTRLGPLSAYGALDKRCGFLGILGCLIPAIIMPYYCAIGGWVLKYLVTFLTGDGLLAANSKFFGGFITQVNEPILYMVIFLLLVSLIVISGVEKGIEGSARLIMPTLFVLILIIGGFSLSLSHTDADGTVRTGMQGLMIYLIPDFTGQTFTSILNVVLDAMGQLFFSISVAMGIMVAYGSYVRDEDNLASATGHIEIFDTLAAFLAGVMILPTVYAFAGREGLAAAGPGLIFVALPKIFAEMGTMGTVIGIMFFALVLFAALTSAVSIMEAVVSSFMDEFGLQRRKATFIEAIIALIAGAIVCLGYNKLFFDIVLPNGAHAQVLDIMDYISNNFLMPLIAFGTCIMIGWMAGPDAIINEAEKNGERFGRRGLYTIMIKYVAPTLLFVLFLQATGLMPKF